MCLEPATAFKEKVHGGVNVKVKCGRSGAPELISVSCDTAKALRFAVCTNADVGDKFTMVPLSLVICHIDGLLPSLEPCTRHFPTAAWRSS